MTDSALTYEVLTALRRLLATDQKAAIPVVKTVSLDFWESLKQWVDQIALTPTPFMMALGGGSGSGKSLVRDVLVKALSSFAPVSAFTQDNYYRDFEADFPHWPLDAFYHRVDFDDPDHIQFAQLEADLARLKTMRYGQTLAIPRLIYGTPQTKPTIVPQGLVVPVTPFIVTEGIHAFYSASLRPLYDFKIYVDVDETTRHARWLARNQRDNRGITENMWQTTVTCLQTHILPSRNHADLVINNAASKGQVTAFIQQAVEVLLTVARQVA